MARFGDHRPQKSDRPGRRGTVGRRAVVCSACAALWLVSAAALGDIIHLRNGNQTEGIIESESGPTVTLLVRGARISVPRSSIVRIEPSNEGTNDLLRGDNLLAQGKYDEAIRTYRYAAGIAPEVISDRIARAATARDEKKSRAARNMERALKLMARDEQIVRLQRELQAGAWPEDVRERLRTRLVEVLLEKSAAARRQLNHSEAYDRLLEAWEVAPDSGAVVLPLARMAIERAEHPATVTAFLRPYLHDHPDDMEAAELLCLHEWENSPFDVVAVLYPGDQVNPRATPGMRKLLPKVLLACFRAQPYPADAPFDRAGCYERYLRLVPDADRRPLYEARIQQEPLNPRHPYELAAYLVSQNKLWEARTALLQVQSISPSYGMVALELENVDAAILRQRIATLEKTVTKHELAFRTLGAILQGESAVDDGADLAEARQLIARVGRRPQVRAGKDPQVYCAELDAYRESLEQVLPGVVSLAFHIRNQREVAIARHRTAVRNSMSYRVGQAAPVQAVNPSGQYGSRPTNSGGGNSNTRIESSSPARAQARQAPSYRVSNSLPSRAPTPTKSSPSPCPGGG